MLERVSAQAESAASLLVRNLERPYRSTRILDTRFWQNGNAELSTNSWWPGYLQHIRDVSQGRQQSSRDGTVTALVSAPSSLWSDFDNTAARRNSSYSVKRRRRSFTVSASTQQKPQRLENVFDLSEEILPEEAEVTSNVRSRNGKPVDLKSRNSQALHEDDKKTDDEISGTDRIVEQDRTEASHTKSKGQPGRDREGEDWDLDSSLASLVSSDRMITLQGSNSSTSTDVPTGNANENEPVEDVVIKSEVVRDTSADSYMGEGTVRYAMHREDDVPLEEDLDERREALHEQLRRKGIEPDFDEVWRLFSLTKNQELDADPVFRHLTKAKHSKDLNRAIEAFRMIPEKQRNATLYRKALDVQLRRYQHREAIDLAFDAHAKNVNLLPSLLRHFVENLLWNSAVELIRRNTKARQDVGKSVLAIKQEAVEYKILVANCQGISDLFSKITSLARRLQDEDATLTQNRPFLESLCKSLILQCAWSVDIAGRMTREGIIALIELGTNLGVTNLHQSILSTFFRDVHKSERADIALFVYRNYRFTAPEDIVNPRMLGSLLSICGAAKMEPHMYGYLLKEFEAHCPHAEVLGAFQRVLTYCARQGQVDAVEHFLQLYISKYGKPKSQAMFHPLIHVRAVSGDIKNANVQFRRLKDEFGLELTTVSWNMLILAHARSGNDLSAFEVFDDMLAAGVEPDPYTYGTLLSVCAKHADVEAAINLLAESRKMNVSVTVPMIHSVVEACLANEDDKQALAFVYATTESGTTESLIRLWNSMMRYYSFKGDSSAMLRLRASMKFYNIKPDEWTYASLMVDLVSRKKTKEAIQMLREMHFKEGIPVTLLHYSIILHGLIAEQNRDMAIIIYTEIKQRFPGMAANIDVAMLNLQNQRQHDTSSAKVISTQLDVLVNMLDKANRQQGSSDRSIPYKKFDNQTTSWFQIFESLLMSLIRGKSYEQAELLLDKLTSSTWFKRAIDHNSDMYMTFSLAQMDLAIAQRKWTDVNSIWQTLFQDAKHRYQSLGVRVREPRPNYKSQSGEEKDAEVSRQTFDGTIRDPKNPTKPIQRKWKFALSSPLNRYITSMSNEGRLDELWNFVKEDFQTAGFELSGRNWNRYIQVLCESSEHRHYVVAFRLTEEHLINRAQSWKLLTRSLLRQRLTQYTLEADKEGKRPVLQKRNSFNVSDRNRSLVLQPSRKIPTYLTFVHLAKVLQQVQGKAQNGNSRLIMAIGGVAPKTKRFIQEMPYLRDRLQGTILRGQQARPDEKPRPRSEGFYRGLADRKGVLGSSSPLDHLPVEFICDIEALVAPRDDIRQVLRSGQDLTLSPQQQRDIIIGEQFEGQVNREPIVLAAKGRFETQEESRKRVSREEQQKLRSVAKIRQDLRTRRLFEDSHRGQQIAPSVPTSEMVDEVAETDNLEDYYSLLKTAREGSKQEIPVLTKLPSEKQLLSAEGEQSNTLDETKSHAPFEKLPVSQQLERLEAYRKAVAERSQTQPQFHSHIRIKGLALPYANVRRVRRILVERQLKATARELRQLGPDNFSDAALGRRVRSSPSELREMARQRRIMVLRQEQALKSGQRLPPMPKTLRALRRSRSTNLPPLRFVADLNRKKWRYQVKRGLIPDLRLEKFKKVAKDEDVYIPAEEMIKRRHPVLTAIREVNPNFGRRKLRRLEVVARALGPPKSSVRGNFEPISELPSTD